MFHCFITIYLWVKFHCLPVSCIGSVPLLCFHCSGPLCQALLPHQPHCSSFSSSIPFHSHSAEATLAYRFPALRTVLCVQNKNKIETHHPIYTYYVIGELVWVEACVTQYSVIWYAVMSQLPCASNVGRDTTPTAPLQTSTFSTHTQDKSIKKQLYYCIGMHPTSTPLLPSGFFHFAACALSSLDWE